MTFSTVGHYAFLVVMQQQFSSLTREKIDAHAYEMGGNLILTFPVEYMSGSSSEEYQRVDGEINYEGENYRLVKEKFYNNIRYVVCIKAHQSSEIRGAMDECSKLFSGQETKGTESNTLAISSPGKYCLTMYSMTKRGSSGWCRKLIVGQLNDLYHFAAPASIFHPPQNS
jgi:hypothetical protein